MTSTKNQPLRNKAAKWAQGNCFSKKKKTEVHEIMCKEKKIA